MPNIAQLEFYSFSAFLIGYQSQDLRQNHIVIKCANFDQDNFPSYIGFGKIKVSLIDIDCDDFSINNMSYLALYLDNSNKPTIRIKTENQIFPDSNSLAILANIGNFTLDLYSADQPGMIGRNREYKQYFVNSESRQYRPNTTLLVGGARIIPLRSQTENGHFLS